MTPDVVVDVGNTRVKWGLVGANGAIVLSGVEEDWTNALSLSSRAWQTDRPLSWLVAGVHPVRQADFVAWARQRGEEVTELTSYQQLPIKFDVEHPEKVGLDRLLGAVAANRLRTPGRAAITVDVGTAVTVNMIEASGAFAGGLILPGVWLMAQSLKQNTAQLPLIDHDIPPFPKSAFPGKTTGRAIQAGVTYAIGGAARLAIEHSAIDGQFPEVFLTGGGALTVIGLLNEYHPRHVPTLNLDGLLITAETLP